MIETPRLLLRVWRDADRAPFAAMGADPEVMAYLGPLQSRAESDASIDRAIAMQARHGHCFWAMERREDGAFLGFCGLKVADDPAPGVEGEIEIGWRLARHAWGAGYAREAARASLDWGFGTLGAARIVALVAAGNTRSWGLMERLRMRRRADLDFDWGAVPAGHELRRTLVYEALSA